MAANNKTSTELTKEEKSIMIDVMFHGSDSAELANHMSYRRAISNFTNIAYIRERSPDIINKKYSTLTNNEKNILLMKILDDLQYQTLIVEYGKLLINLEKKVRNLKLYENVEARRLPGEEGDEVEEETEDSIAAIAAHYEKSKSVAQNSLSSSAQASSAHESSQQQQQQPFEFDRLDSDFRIIKNEHESIHNTSVDDLYSEYALKEFKDAIKNSRPNPNEHSMVSNMIKFTTNSAIKTANEESGNCVKCEESIDSRTVSVESPADKEKNNLQTYVTEQDPRIKRLMLRNYLSKKKADIENLTIDDVVKNDLIIKEDAKKHNVVPDDDSEEYKKYLETLTNKIGYSADYD